MHRAALVVVAALALAAPLAAAQDGTFTSEEVEHQRERAELETFEVNATVRDGGRAVDLQWPAQEGATRYEVYVNEDEPTSPRWTFVGEAQGAAGGGVRFTDDAPPALVASGETVMYVVFAFGGGGEPVAQGTRQVESGTGGVPGPDEPEEAGGGFPWTFVVLGAFFLLVIGFAVFLVGASMRR